jgi:hypothetical protein
MRTSEQPGATMPASRSVRLSTIAAWKARNQCQDLGCVSRLRFVRQRDVLPIHYLGASSPYQ